MGDNSDDDFICDESESSVQLTEETEYCSSGTDDHYPHSEPCIPRKRVWETAFRPEDIFLPLLEGLATDYMEEYRGETHQDKKIKNIRDEIDVINKNDINIVDRILLSENIPIKIKASIVSKIETSCNSDKAKLTNWANEVVKLPLGIYKELPVNKTSKDEEINNFLKKAREIIDDTVYGMENTKEEILDFLTNFIYNDGVKGTILGLHSPPGCGKTQICRALSDILCLPFFQLNFGGTTDPAVFIGHDMTYIGSKCGKVAQTLKRGECMNPIIYLDEIDKIGNSDKSKEVYGVLTHLLDETQNSSFEDLYFQDIPLDLSRALFICSFNDITAIDPIVLNRVKIINLKELKIKDKINIVQKHLLPKINHRNIVFNDYIVEYIISQKTVKEPGMRKIKENVTTLVNRINTMIMLEKCEDRDLISSDFSYKDLTLDFSDGDVLVTTSLVDTILKSNDKREWMSMYC